MDAVRRIVRRMQRFVPRGSGTTILAYHLVDAGTSSRVEIPRAMFARHLDALSSDVRLTFDDAYLNFYDICWPMLRERNLAATLYVPIAFVDGGQPPMRGAPGPCSWAQLRAMAGQGLTIGSHTINHVNLRRAPMSVVHREVEVSKKVLEDRLGVAVETFCYPQGKWSRAAERVVRRTYRSAVVGGGGKVDPSRPWRMPRVSITRDMSEDIVPVLEAAVWLEEWFGDQTRKLRP